MMTRDTEERVLAFYYFNYSGVHLNLEFCLSCFSTGPLHCSVLCLVHTRELAANERPIHTKSLHAATMLHHPSVAVVPTVYNVHHVQYVYIVVYIHSTICVCHCTSLLPGPVRLIRKHMSSSSLLLLLLRTHARPISNRSPRAASPAAPERGRPRGPSRAPSRRWPHAAAAPPSER